MKKLFLSLAAAVSFTAASAQSTHPIYLYTEDGLYDIYYTGDISNIGYSETDAEGNVHSNVVSQVITTAEGSDSMLLNIITRASFIDPESASFINPGKLNILTSKAYRSLISDYSGEFKFLGSRPAVVFFWQKGSSECSEMKERLRLFAKDYSDTIDFFSIDADEETEVRDALGISTFPLTAFHGINGVNISEKGVLDDASLKDIIDNKLLSVPTEYAAPALRSPVVAVSFTGQTCRYCPNMERGLQEMQDRYGADNYIFAALHHLSSFSQLPAGYVSLYHEEAEQYATSIDIPPGLPHVYYNALGSKVCDLPIDDMFKEPDLLECNMKVSVTDNNEYEININTKLREDRKEFIKDKNVDLVMWALESKIVAYQDDNGKVGYPEHNHIFRGSINGTWGEHYDIGTEYKRTLPVPERVAEVGNTDVVVFFIDHDTREILDACHYLINK